MQFCFKKGEKKRVIKSQSVFEKNKKTNQKIGRKAIKKPKHKKDEKGKKRMKKTNVNMLNQVPKNLYFKNKSQRTL
jgi:hypothetical protein